MGILTGLASFHGSYKENFLIIGNGIHSLTSLNVTVLDVNDNSPNFDIALITEEIKVPENAAPNTLVFKANAVDLDEGENGRVSIFEEKSRKRSENEIVNNK